MSADDSTRELIRQLQMLGCWDTARAVADDAAREDATATGEDGNDG